MRGFLNLKSRIFLGDSGNYFLSTLLGSLIIFNNDEPIDPVDPKIAIFFILNNYKQKNPKWYCKNYSVYSI